LLDTRIATVSRLNQQAAIDLLLTEEYYSRVSDEMGKYSPLISTDEYQLLYQKRDILTLMAARPTDLYPELKQLILSIEAKMVQASTIESAEIVINTYPYQLTDEEKSIIIESIVTLGNFTIPVKCIYVPYADMSLELIRTAGWTALIMYNFTEWLELTFNKAGFDPNTCARLTGVPFYIPGLVKDKDVEYTEEERKLPNGRFMNKYEGMKMALAPFFNVEFLTTQTFSIYLPPEPKES